ncbi:MAG TPA: imidazole glycerol phosphate synthase subunit HisH, partial [Planctomycetota bacterium]|nr:imidazole glycerol phosphate synthase subunit HisH [Planctomycetota bacterium]
MVVDYGLGNLYSVARACRAAGLQLDVTSDPEILARADGIVLPGVGAFGDAMQTLRARGLDVALRGAVEHGVPLMAICLGIQLLMTESEEFGRHEGLKILPGRVVRLPDQRQGERRLKVPLVGWAELRPRRSWLGTPLEGAAPGVSMYFVHSYFVQPENRSVILSTTRYGQAEFCSSLEWRGVFAC